MSVTRMRLLAWLLTGAVVGAAVYAQSSQEQASPSGARAAAGTATPRESKTHLFLPGRSLANGRAIRSYRLLWGIDDIVVRSVSSGALVRFSYRVVDASKAKALNDKKITPYLIDESQGAALQVPSMEQVGQLRQTDTPENGREYWMVFSNKRGYVKPGNHVDIVIGNFRISGLLVQ